MTGVQTCALPICVCSYKTVTSWADAGTKADLAAGRWVQLGPATKVNFYKTGLPGPKVYSQSEFPWMKYSSSKADFANSITREVPASSLQWPTGGETWKGFIGQRILIRPIE